MNCVGDGAKSSPSNTPAAAPTQHPHRTEADLSTSVRDRLLAAVLAENEHVRSSGLRLPKPSPCREYFTGRLCTPAEATEIRETFGHHAQQKNVSLGYRDGDLYPHTPRERTSLTTFASTANQTLWHHNDLTCVSVSIMHYEAGSSFAWHCDGIMDPERHWVGVIASLSDPDFYDGGELQIGQHATPIKLPLGHAVALPGDLEHRVLQIESGHRWMLTAFFATA